ncbi:MULTISPECIES: iron-containing alcohol dehydrogenase [unclassified Oceanispirochaeta]|uniref:iron-containing alcohol dehydrogenase n=1 Tax=unclassified Oceanispirochaeta TaxID=2635722 RepID=UPI000E093317|nr:MULTISPECIES: iron-containing alcohol dehydrogenase [unclassified Oceanispirochaeta]MBF9014953.1 iron-containing alcohol dehydrogenase [Oceanispirochaeta sp. M2]NPD71366.1 iron-containing alcohol dehydrogenase [Oceanispirochaeta sp. M1]RDG33331.1 iron-containing alcohol dehydrogenase [Oceanispirochaeta sp. M1]
MNGIKVSGIKAYQKIVKVLIAALNFVEPETLTGPGSVLKISDYLKKNNFKKPLIVTDEGIVRVGLLKGMLDNFKEQGIEYAVYDKIIPNPTIQVIEEAREMFIEKNCDCFIGFGGGSSMDSAKVASARVTNPRTSIMQMTGYFKIRKKIKHLIAVPTTSGTGSECTVAAVITNPETKAKYAVDSPKLIPSLAVMDPELSYGLPPHITSTTGMDALTHAVEAYISTIPTKLTDDYARRAVKIIFEDLETCFKDGKNTQARENMMWASYYGGAAFTRALVGNVHAIAHNFGGLYHVPHGLANAIVLPHVLEASIDKCDTRLAELAEAAGLKNEGKSTREMAEAFIQKIRDLNKTFEIPETVRELRKEDLTLLAERASKEAFYFYAPPKYFSAVEMEKVLEPMLA